MATASADAEGPLRCPRFVLVLFHFQTVIYLQYSEEVEKYIYIYIYVYIRVKLVFAVRGLTTVSKSFFEAFD